MSHLFFSIFSILMGLGFIGVGNGLLNISIPSKATQFGFDPFLIGLLTAFYYLGFLLGCFVTPRVVKKVGHIRSFTCFAAMLCIASLSFAYDHSPALWITLRTLAGFAIAGIYMIAESWLNESADNSNRGKVISIYRIVDLVALMGGAITIRKLCSRKPQYLYRSSNFD